MSKINDNLHVGGTLSATNFEAPAGSITSAAFSDNVNHELSHEKQQHRRYLTYIEGSDVQPAASRTVLLGVLRNGGSIESVKIRHQTAPTGTTSHTTVDAKINGASVLDAPEAYTPASSGTVEATISDDEVEADDVVSATITSSAGDGAKGYGLLVEICILENGHN